MTKQNTDKQNTPITQNSLKRNSSKICGLSFNFLGKR